MKKEERGREGHMGTGIEGGREGEGVSSPA